MVVHRTSTGLITYNQEIVDGQPLYVSSNSAPIKALRYEPAGHAFHFAARELLCCVEKVEESGGGKGVKSDDDDDDEKEESYEPSYGSYRSKGKKGKKSSVDKPDHYAVLGLNHLRYLASEDQIKKSYRECALKYHPDKQAVIIFAEKSEAAKEAKKEEIESRFRSIQEAYEVLMDPTKRRVFDSTDEFDSRIPVECSPGDFFKVFGPSFVRNGRWSVIQPIIVLGDDKTPISEVDKFYEFWYNFKSWREFPDEDEHDLEDAESRDEKRWMERQNAKLREKANKDEYARIRRLVDNAYRKDPRILRRKEEEKAEKQRKKQARYFEKNQQEAEAARIAEEEKRRKEEEEKLAAEAALEKKKLKEKEKKLVRKERSRLRTLSTPAVSQHLFDLSNDDIENLCTSLDLEQLRSLCEKIEGKEPVELGKVLKNACNGNHDAEEDNDKNNKEELKNVNQNGFEDNKQELTNGHQNGYGTVYGKVPNGSTEKKERPWVKEEIDMLRKGVLKFPKGTSRRWEVISEYIGTERTVEEILKATKTVLLQKPDSAKAFDSFLEKRKPAPVIASPLTTREETEGRPTTPQKSETESSKTVVVDDMKEKSANNSTGIANTVVVDDMKEKSANTSTGIANGNGSENNHNQNHVDSANGVSASVDEDEWSAVQVTALVQALKTFPKESNQRWERVAAAIPGKNVNQCKKKFASLKNNFRNKKTGS